MELHTTDVLVIGAGGAGLRAAIAACEQGRDTLVVGRRARRDAHTVLASGGINAALGSRDPQDSWEHHFADTVAEAYYLADPRAVEILTREAPAAVETLAAWGCDFARTDDGQIDQRFFGAHRYRRTCYVGDETGKAMLHALADRADALRIPVRDELAITRLLVEGGECVGAAGFDLADGSPVTVLAGSVVLATGGHTRVWHQSTSRPGENAGDGMAMALEAGCALADLELVQFHPTGMVAPESAAGTLVTEAVRGEGGRLFNAEGERFMERYDPERLELSTRDRVALAAYTEIAEGRGGPNDGVFLDITHVDAERIHEKLPKMHRQFLDLQGIDITSERMEVAPTAHYSMGGVVVSPEDGACDLPGLFAAGEVTSGVHGANRLGGNSLAETVVFGRRAGEAAAAHAGAGGRRASAAVPDGLPEVDAVVGGGGVPPDEVRTRLGALLWSHAGVCRTADGLQEGIAGFDELRAAAAEIRVEPREHGWQLVAEALAVQRSLDVAEVTLRAALARAESRGAHQRSDHPDVDPDLTVRFAARRSEGALTWERLPVPPVPGALRPYLEDAEELDLADRLLE